MNKISEFETFLNVSKTKFGIYLFDTKNKKNLYSKEITFEKTIIINYSYLNKFLNENIFRIEKLLGRFVENIFIIIDHENILNIQIGIKQKNYQLSKSKVYLQSSIANAKDLFKENYPNENNAYYNNNYLIDGKNHFYLQDNLEYDELNLVIRFRSISNEITYNLNKILQIYQINIIKFLDGNYVQNFNKDKGIEISKMAFDILNGCNINEVMVVQKSTKKLGFFEKFFQLFS